MGERGRPIDAVTRARIRRLLFERWPIGTIGRHCGVHRTTIYRIQNQMVAEGVFAEKPNRTKPRGDIRNADGTISERGGPI